MSCKPVFARRLDCLLLFFNWLSALFSVDEKTSEVARIYSLETLRLWEEAIPLFQNPAKNRDGSWRRSPVFRYSFYHRDRYLQSQFLYHYLAWQEDPPSYVEVRIIFSGHERCGPGTDGEKKNAKIAGKDIFSSGLKTGLLLRRLVFEGPMGYTFLRHESRIYQLDRFNFAPKPHFKPRVIHTTRECDSQVNNGSIPWKEFLLFLSLNDIPR